MIPLYIVAYLVVGLVVKWLCERFYPPTCEDYTVDCFSIIFWPILLVGVSIVLLIDYVQQNENNHYTRIRKFFRGF